MFSSKARGVIAAVATIVLALLGGATRLAFTAHAEEKKEVRVRRYGWATFFTVLAAFIGSTAFTSRNELRYG